MSKVITVQDGKIELIVADGASSIDIGADGTLAGSVNLGARVSVDNNGNIVIQDSTDTYTWTIAPQAGWLDINASDPGNTEYGMYFDTGGEVGLYDYVVTASSQPPIAADGLFEAKFNIWSRANPTEYEIAAFGFSGGPNLEIYNGILGGNINIYAFNDAGAAQTLITLDPDTQSVILPTSNDAASPTLAFGSLSTGFYESSAGVIGITVAGTQRFRINSNYFEGVSASQASMYRNTPSATVPGFTFNADYDTGIGSNAADQLSLIAGGVEMLRLVETGVATTDQIIIGPAGVIGSAAAPTLAFGDGDTGFYENADDTIYISTAGTARWGITSGAFASLVANGPQIRNILPTATVPNFNPRGSADPNTGIGSPANNQLSLITNAVEANRIIAAAVQTTDATVTEIIGIPVPANEGFGFEIHIMGTDDTNDDVVFERIFGAIYNAGGTTAIVGSTMTDRTDTASASGWVVTVAADDALDELTVDVTGAAVTIDWKVRVELLNV